MRFKPIAVSLTAALITLTQPAFANNKSERTYPDSYPAADLEILSIPFNNFPARFVASVKEQGTEIELPMHGVACNATGKYGEDFNCEWNTIGLKVEVYGRGAMVHNIDIWTDDRRFLARFTPQAFRDACAAAIAMAAPKWPKAQVLKLAKELTPPTDRYVNIGRGDVDFIGTRDRNDLPGVPPLWKCAVNAAYDFPPYQPGTPTILPK